VGERASKVAVDSSKTIFLAFVHTPLHSLLVLVRPVGALPCPKAARALPGGRQGSWSTRQCSCLLMIIWRSSSYFV